ncbi:MAG: sulfite exporter TauE/SafE family protein [Candidatus Pacearchaeota archaeon]|jgi:hypothetical protein
MEIFILLIILFAGIIAGIFTGFSGGSATNIFIPMLVLLAGYSPYMAVGVALTVDVFSCIIAFSVYNRKIKIKFKPFIPLLISSLIGVFMGSYYSVQVPSNLLEILIGVTICFIGFKFITKKKSSSSNTHKKVNKIFKKYKMVISVLFGLIIGMVCGFFGGGGGLLLLGVLILILNYETHEAIGLSVLIMLFLALFGGAIHYFYMPFPLIPALIGCIGGVIGAMYSSVLANKISEDKLNIIVGIFLLIMGGSLLVSGALL